ncbi:circularly permuted type 2 ATP-grasp protein [Variovorax dokdonensis]|uniref:circularly permuted type 2 ATP-grasp protein n=1 Tax=Variovorax dokdonensis TaxID=344883 RepID=UPI002646C12F|nr:circularly permuted type 2 ATP-grasp protein [Variovorax dokdonensis]
MFDVNSPQALAALAANLAPPAAPGHFDELRGRFTPPPPPSNAVSTSASATGASAGAPLRDAAAPAIAPPTIDDAAAGSSRLAEAAPLSPAWTQFFEELGTDGFDSLSERARSLAHQIRDNGVTYNVYADQNGPQRPWSLDLFPLILSPETWATIEAGVLQRVKLLDRILADVYGPQTLLSKGLLPSALVQGHPSYLRGMHGVRPPGDTWLHIAAFDLGRGPHGNWRVLSQRTQAPSGLGYLLENRIAVSRQFPQAFESLHVQRLASTYIALMDALQRMCPTEAQPHIALLTPGPYNETYFEHAYLARYLGITLVEGSDLTVRDSHLFLKTLEGLRPVHGLIKRLDDQFLDPLELRPDSTLGVPGLLQAIRAGNVLVANMPGSGFLESPALLGFLPGIAQALTGESLQLPSLPTWWCGEHAAMEAVLPQLSESVIKSTYPDSNGQFQVVLGSQMDRRTREEWAGRIALAGEAHTVQGYLPLSQMPTWAGGDARSGQIAPRAVVLRVFAISDGPGSWRMLPGGMARIAGPDTKIASMQRGGSSADTWVQTHDVIDRTTLLATHASMHALTRNRAPVTSRAAENLFWFGRYTERAENTVRLARLALNLLPGEDQASPALLDWLYQLARHNGLVPRDAQTLPRSRRVFERTLIAELGNPDGGSVSFSLRCIRDAASAVRERLSVDHWNQIERTNADFAEAAAELVGGIGNGPNATYAALGALERATQALAALTGAQTDRMTRDDGWRLLSIGRHIERLAFLTDALMVGIANGAVHELPGFEAILALFDSTITFHARYQQRRDVAPLVDLLVLDRDNPRSLAWVTHTLRGRIARLAGSAPGELAELSHRLPDPAEWSLARLCAPEESPDHPTLMALIDSLETATYQVSDEIGARYFTLTAESLRSVGA